MMKRPDSIDTLLERYYDGSTSPEEEVTLYLLLLQEDRTSPYLADKMLLEASLHRAAEQKAPEGAKGKTALLRRQAWFRKYSAAAAILLIAGVGAAFFQWGRESRQAELSLYNGEPISQRQADEYALAAFAKLGDCVNICSDQQEVIDDVFGRLQASYQASMSRIPLDEQGNWIITNNP